MNRSFRLSLALFAFALFAPALAVLTPVQGTLPEASAAVRQTATITLTPQISQNGKLVANANAAKLVGTMKFRPIRKGRPVVIQRRLGSRAWQKVAVVRQNGRGVVTFQAVGTTARGMKQAYKFRGVAQRWRGLPAKATPVKSVADLWSQKFNDAFSGTSLSSKWSVRNPGIYDVKGDRACSTSAADAVRVAQGRVVLQVKPDESKKDLDCVDPLRTHYTNRTWYKNGHISTQGAFQFTRGVAAARVKFAKPVGAHGSFWMQSAVPYRAGLGPAQNGAEIDVVEYFGKAFKKGDIYSFVHYTDAAGDEHKVPNGVPLAAARKALKGATDDWFKRYHVFSVEWTPSAYIFRVDGIQTLKVTQGVSKVPEFLILSMLSSGWELERVPAASRDKFTASTQVDWVRVWQRK